MKILEVNNLELEFSLNKMKLKAIRSVSFHLNRGEILGVVGESGCGNLYAYKAL